MATRGATLKMVKAMRISFDPFCSSNAVTIAREFLRRVSSPKLIETNPKFKLSAEIKSDGSSPSIEVTYVDKDTQVLDLNSRFEDVYANFIKSCRAKE
ncbi:uncharacterized protein LOC130655250 [Hydractinia symbiolongicarpus]|uniref:uncharacterized protein LOC130655250 n=1 Tax=Hydractinia symbiolongicarpus TaxID=13093 RepID=UPI00254ECB92|nr:uncharacterized protein LOC130655250 [Hydractinia symbiolongicarpus]